MIKLLIVDDEPLVQIGIKSMINWADLGVEICGTAMNGEAALKLIEEYSPEIVITDIKMPKMNGWSLRKLPGGLRQIPLFIFLTSYEEFQLIKQAMNYQAVDYLIKLELTPDSLTASVRRALERLEEYRASQAYRKKGGEDRPTLQAITTNFSYACCTTCSTAKSSSPSSPGTFGWISPTPSIWRPTERSTATPQTR